MTTSIPTICPDCQDELLTRQEILLGPPTNNTLIRLSCHSCHGALDEDLYYLIGGKGSGNPGEILKLGVAPL